MTDLVEYRMWDKDKQEMFYGPIVDEYKAKVDEDNDRYVFMRYLNKKDDYGTKIYVSDVFKIVQDVSEEEDEEPILSTLFMKTVVDEEGNIRLYDHTGYSWRLRLPNNIESMAVVGNLYENESLEKLFS